MERRIRERVCGGGFRGGFLGDGACFVSAVILSNVLDILLMTCVIPVLSAVLVRKISTVTSVCVS